MHCTVSFYLQTIGPNLDNAAVVKLKFIYSEKATQFCEIYILDLSYVAMVKSTVEILQTFVAFSEYMNCKPNLGVFGRQFWRLVKNNQPKLYSGKMLWYNLILEQYALAECGV